MPMRYKLYEEEPWHSLGLRVLLVGNYLVFYLLNEANGVVNIVHIMYGGRDISKQFHDIWIKKAARLVSSCFSHDKLCKYHYYNRYTTYRHSWCS